MSLEARAGIGPAATMPADACEIIVPSERLIERRVVEERYMVMFGYGDESEIVLMD